MELLAIHWNVDPVLIHLGNFGIRWYSLLFVLGFVIGWYIFKWFFRREGIPEKLLDPLLYTLLICTIVGARLGHCIFYQPDYYFGTWQGFWEIFQPWKGGLASHGGTIALFLGMWWFSAHYGKKHDFDYIWLLDHLAIAVALTGSLIRLGNLFNSEIYGPVTSQPWGVIFEIRGETEPRHPTQMYESITYMVLFIILITLYKFKLDKLHRGFFIGLFLVGCFGMRFIIEYVKEATKYFNLGFATINIGQLLSIPFVLLGIFFLIYAAVRKIPARAVHPEEQPKPKEQTHYAKPLNR
ncbi:MAG: prolipoprotein diacylglyceryl transferase [Bacteroidales bacterium]|nr:prolipoprotein diacylglyceryl transferase [Bacteroidales bacterium]